MGKKELRVFGGLVLGALSALTITACTGFGSSEHLSGGRPVSEEVATSSGRVNLRDVAGPAKVEANFGDVDLTMGRPAGVTVRSGSGTVVVVVPSGPYRVYTEVGTGKSDVSVPSDPAAPNPLDLRSESGDITVRPA